MSGSTSDLSTDAGRERVLKQTLQLLDITRDIERNQADADFARDGEILYVFDENVFEMFVRPYAWGPRMATFYSPLWLDGEATRPPRSWASISAQSALLASEYLISGRLPGQLEPEIYMTEWHFWELRLRIERLAEGFQQRAKSILEDMAEELARRPRPAFLRNDLGELKRHPAIWTREALERFKVTRVVATQLADDRTLEPLEQLSRIVTEPLRSRIVGLQDRFEIPPTEIDIIATNARAWRARLEEEQRLRHGPNNRGKRKSFKSDALSLAYVQWAARKWAGTQRKIVFVTGDTIVFDAYRRWHAKVDPSSSEYFDPFILRRLVQYAPIFNMNDASSDISGAKELFERTRAAVEVALLPFNLSRMGAPSHRLEQIDRGREFLALQLVDTPVLREHPVFKFFGGKMTPDWLRENDERLKEITTLWQRTERIAIGSMYDTVLPRVDGVERPQMVRRGGAGGAALGPALTGYVENLLDRIVEDSVKLWAPLAARFITKRLADAVSARGERARPPIYLDLRSYNPDLSLDWGDLHAQLSGEASVVKSLLRDAGEEFPDQPEILFGVASALALLLGLWGDANRFAELAMKSSSPVRTSDIEVRVNGEFTYLYALAKRFKIGEYAPVRSEGAFTVTRKEFEDAKRLLDACEPCVGEEGAPDPVKRLRLHSERAALHLFYFAAVMLSPNPEIRSRFAASGQATSTLDAADSDLQRCLELGQTSQAILPEAECLAMQRIRRQYLANVAAATVLRIIGGFGPPCAHLVSTSAVQRVRDLLRHEPRLPGISRLDMMSYLLIASAPEPRLARDTRALAARYKSDPTLALDAATAAAIGDWVARQVS